MTLKVLSTLHRGTSQEVAPWITAAGSHSRKPLRWQEPLSILRLPPHLPSSCSSHSFSLPSSKTKPTDPSSWYSPVRLSCLHSPTGQRVGSVNLAVDPRLPFVHWRRACAMFRLEEPATGGRHQDRAGYLYFARSDSLRRRGDDSGLVACGTERLPGGASWVAGRLSCSFRLGLLSCLPASMGLVCLLAFVLACLLSCLLARSLAALNFASYRDCVGLLLPDSGRAGTELASPRSGPRIAITGSKQPKTSTLLHS